MSIPINFETPTMTAVKKPSDIPFCKCYIIQFYEIKSVYHEGDERSRTAPGHGYPAYTENYLDVKQYVTVNETEWKEAVQALSVTDKVRYDFVAFVCQRALIRTSVQIAIE